MRFDGKDPDWVDGWRDVTVRCAREWLEDQSTWSTRALIEDLVELVDHYADEGDGDG